MVFEMEDKRGREVVWLCKGKRVFVLQQEGNVRLY